MIDYFLSIKSKNNITLNQFCSSSYGTQKVWQKLLEIMIQVQLSLIIVGLFLALPFVVTNEYVPEGGIVGNFTDSTPPWVGSIEMEDAWIWTDNMLMLIMGGLPWQVYFQRGMFEWVIFELRKRQKISLEPK